MGLVTHVGLLVPQYHLILASKKVDAHVPGANISRLISKRHRKFNCTTRWSRRTVVILLFGQTGQQALPAVFEASNQQFHWFGGSYL